MRLSFIRDMIVAVHRGGRISSGAFSLPLPALAGVGIAAFVLGSVAPPVDAFALRTFSAHFLSVFIEALPFLLAGTLVSGLVESFARPDALARLVPRGALPRAIAGALLGFLFPVCECGVVPVVRRLLRKGVPATAAVAFLLAAPIVNPIVLWSTAAAFGWGPVLYARFSVAIAVAVVTALIAGGANLRVLPGGHEHAHPQPRGAARKFLAALSIAGDETLEMGAFLVFGCAAAAAMRTLVPQGALTAIGGGNIVSVAVMQLTAFVLSVCSTVDAFIAFGFAGAFGTGAIVAFLTFGPMIDIKSTLLFLSVFPRRTVAALLLLPLVLTFVAGVALNFLLP